MHTETAYTREPCQGCGDYQEPETFRACPHCGATKCANCDKGDAHLCITCGLIEKRKEFPDAIY